VWRRKRAWGAPRTDGERRVGCPAATCCGRRARRALPHRVTVSLGTADDEYRRHSEALDGDHEARKEPV
jgi:hypothetical protein